MESRNVKVIDEHSIDRDAYVVCGINVDNIDYVLYAIERDGENDNLFASKIIKNIDGTSNMINIEDNIEKNKINDAVKELITYSIKNENDKTTGSVSLNDGKVVNIFNVLFNKEQNINVSKTYITTVKKSVTKVSEDFYNIPDEKKEENVNKDTFENVNNDIFIQPLEPAIPLVNDAIAAKENVNEVNMPDTSVELNIPSVDDKKDEINVNNNEQINSVPQEQVQSTEMPELNSAPIVLGEEKPLTEENNVSSEVTPSPVDETVESKPIENPIKENEPVIPTTIPVQPMPTVIPSVIPTPAAEIKPEPILNEVETNINNNASLDEPKLFFDGSKEINLKKALGEVSNTLSTHEEGVESLREFGVDTSQNNLPDTNAPVVEKPKVLKKSKGFANNKFFMIIAILFFIGACVFLGYEAFNYFKLIK